MSTWSVHRVTLARPPKPNLICSVQVRHFYWPWLLAVGMYGDELSLWMRARDDAPADEEKRLFIGCTGGICPPHEAGTPLGTVIDGENRWHVFLMTSESKWTPSP